MSAPRLQILISTKGIEGIERIDSLPHPEIPGVQYLVSWQQGDLSRLPDDLKRREDFKIVLEDSVGLSRNRNNAMKNATADWVLISDDDLIYTEEHIKNVIESFEKNPDYSVLAFRYESEDFPRKYSLEEFDLNNPPKGYFTVSFEIGLNLKQIRMQLKDDVIPLFNENFGLGSTFGSGEEDLFVANLLKHNLKGKFIPVDVCEHPGPTTSHKEKTTDGFIRTQGAVISRLKPSTWPLRMIVHAFRSSIAKDGSVNFFRYVSQFLKGVVMARKLKVFDFKPFMKK